MYDVYVEVECNECENLFVVHEDDVETEYDEGCSEDDYRWNTVSHFDCPVCERRTMCDNLDA